MKVLIAGAGGAIGVPIAARLGAAGHQVVGLTRTSQGAARLSAAGVRPVVADALDRASLLRALEGESADVVVHQLTSLTKPPARHSDMRQTNRLRTEGTKNLLEAARLLGATRFVTQSIVFGYGYTDHGSKTLTEADPFGEAQPGNCAPHVAAMLTNEQQVRDADGIDGIALRYGLFYGADREKTAAMLHKRRLPIPAKGSNYLPWIHIDDAAAATVTALEHGQAGAAYNIVDDQPCTWGQMFSTMAEELGAPAPRALPAWMIRLAAPYAGAVLGTNMQVSNAKAKAELRWRPHFPGYRDGLKALAAR